MHAWIHRHVHRHVTETHYMEALGRRTTSAYFLTCRLARRSLATPASPRPVFVLVWCEPGPQAREVQADLVQQPG